MRLFNHSHLLAVCLTILAVGTSSGNAYTLDFLRNAQSHRLPFVSTLQAIISHIKPDYPLRPTSKVTTMRFKNIFHQGTHSYRGLSARYDIPQIHSSALGDQSISLTMKTTRVKSWRPKDTSAFLHAHRHADYIGIKQTSQDMDWDEIEVDAPDVTDRETLLALGRMASKAYDAPANDSQSDWMVGSGGKWNLSESFGWVEDGIRGHIFATDDNATIVVALKGTSAALLDDGTTSKRDKENDNLLFSCCCAHVGFTWHTVCDCYTDQATKSKSISPSLSASNDGPTCASSCLTKAIIKKSFYYPATTDLFNNISYAYPNSQIWITGHSLGGALGALIGMTFGYPTVTFEAPAERMAAIRLHLPLPVKHDNMEALPITHVYHTADPIPMGECVGATSLCANFGFAMESKCHSGKSILYDTIGKLGWSSSVVTHRIATMLDTVLDEDWDKKVEKTKAKLTSVVDEAPSSKTSRWHLPWLKSGQEDDKKGEESLGAVPKPTSEKHCRDCTEWTFTDDDKKVSLGL